MHKICSWGVFLKPSSIHPTEGHECAWIIDIDSDTNTRIRCKKMVCKIHVAVADMMGHTPVQRMVINGGATLREGRHKPTSAAREGSEKQQMTTKPGNR